MTAYDELPYDCHPIPGTAPEQLAMTAFFHGGVAPAATGIRYLEIGCGDGANLLPLAYHRPESHFTGADASGVQIAAARRSARQLTVDNVALHDRDVRTMANDLTIFDYIVAHGVMSWVSSDVRNGIFRFCREHLSPQGLFYTTFNAYPGWKVRGMVRDLLIGHTRTTGSLRERAGIAREVAAFLHSKILMLEHPYAQLLAHELHRIADCTDSYLVHEYLSEHNQPFWHHEFVTLAAAFGLRYVADPGYNLHDYHVPAPLHDVATQLETEPVLIDEVVDLLWYRQHRLALFCRDDAVRMDGTARMNGAVHPERARPILERAQIACGLRNYSGHGRLAANVTEVFHGYFESDYRIELCDPLAKAAIATLTERWPAALPLDALVRTASDRLVEAGLPRPEDGDWDRLAALLLDLHGSGQVDLRLRDSHPTVDAGDLPAVCPLTRWEAQHRSVVTTPQHHRIGLSVTERLLVAGLDGTRDRDAIARDVSGQLQNGEMRGDHGELVTANAANPGRVGQILEHLLDVLGPWGLLQKT